MISNQIVKYARLLPSTESRVAFFSRCAERLRPFSVLPICFEDYVQQEAATLRVLEFARRLATTSRTELKQSRRLWASVQAALGKAQEASRVYTEAAGWCQQQAFNLGRAEEIRSLEIAMTAYAAMAALLETARGACRPIIRSSDFADDLALAAYSEWVTTCAWMSEAEAAAIEDCHWLRQHVTPTKSAVPAEFFDRPIWTPSFPKNWSLVLDAFRAAVLLAEPARNRNLMSALTGHDWLGFRLLKIIKDAHRLPVPKLVAQTQVKEPIVLETIDALQNSGAIDTIDDEIVCSDRGSRVIRALETAVQEKGRAPRTSYEFAER